MTNKQEIAVLIGSRIDASGKTQTEIAEEVGIEQSFLSMIRNNKAKVPIGRILALADALDIPRAELLRKCLDAYEPELLAILRSVFPGIDYTEEEIEIVRVVRAARAMPAALRAKLAPVPMRAPRRKPPGSE
jgi:transcriptional regulator with XRE-family HTH domain